MSIIEDKVNHPSHYTDGKIEVIEFIEDKKLDFCLGNAIKYISRAGKKDPEKEVEDLEKAIWYIKRKIKQIKENPNHRHATSFDVKVSPLEFDADNDDFTSFNNEDNFILIDLFGR